MIDKKVIDTTRKICRVEKSLNCYKSSNYKIRSRYKTPHLQPLQGSQLRKNFQLGINFQINLRGKKYTTKMASIDSHLLFTQFKSTYRTNVKIVLIQLYFLASN